MKKLISLIEKSIAFIENAPINFSYLLVSLFSIIAIRIFIENWIATLQNRTGSFLFYEISHTFLFFLISFISFLAIIKIILKVDFKKAANVVLLGFLVILTPPIIDYILSGGKGFWSFYKFDGIIGLIQRFFTFFGDKPEIGVTYGVRIDIIISLIFLGFYAYFKSRKISKIFITLVVSYFILFILGTFPSYIAIAIEGFSKGFLNITDINVAKMFLSPAMLFSKEIPDIVSSLNIKMSLVYVPIFSILIFSGLYFYAQNKFIALIKNIRLPQIIYHIGLFSLGMALSFIWMISFFMFLDT